MSQATDGIVWWGIAFGDREYEVHERIAEIINGQDGDDLYGDGREWLTERGLFGKVEFVEFCSMSSPMYGVAAAGTVVTARRGWVKPLDLAAPPAGWSIDVQAAVEALGQDLAHADYGWKLASWWET